MTVWWVWLVFSLQNFASYMRDKRTRTMDDTNMDTRNYTSPEFLVYIHAIIVHEYISFFAFQSLCHFHKYICCFLMSVWIACTKHQSPDDNDQTETEQKNLHSNDNSRALPFTKSARINPKQNADTEFIRQNQSIPINSHKVHTFSLPCPCRRCL